MELSERYTFMTCNRAKLLTDEEMEHIKVQSLEEYLGHNRMVQMNRTMASTELISIPFITLVAGKLILSSM